MAHINTPWSPEHKPSKAEMLQHLAEVLVYMHNHTKIVLTAKRIAGYSLLSPKQVSSLMKEVDTLSKIAGQKITYLAPVYDDTYMGRKYMVDAARLSF